MKSRAATVAFGVLVALTSLVGGCASSAPITPRSDPAPSSAAGTERTADPGRSEHVDADSTVGDVVNHPAFEGFGRYILPLDGGSWDDEMPLAQYASLLPWHANLSVEAAVSTVNAVVDEVAEGEQLFYDIYTPEQIKQDPAKEHTGLFFFRGDPGAPVAVISPGGGFSYVGSIQEGFPYALELSGRGYSAFVLQYRVGGEHVACEDLATALGYIFDNAQALNVDTEDYSLWGSSAGARMAARIGTSGVAAYGGPSIPQPATVVMAYTGHTDYSKNDPPTFAVVGEDDGIASPSTMERRVENLQEAGIDAEFHEYPNVGHGFGLGLGTSAEGWIDLAVQFWASHIRQ